jgi:hypothetical protein
MISAPRSALLEPEPNSKIRRRFPGNNPSSLGGPVSIAAGHTSGTAVLEYGSTEILPPIGAMLTRPTSLCRPRRQLSRAHPRETPGFSTYEGGCGRETDSPLEGGGFEPSVPLYGEFGALGRVRRDPRRHREARNARSFASTRSASDLRHAWGWTKPGSRSASATSSIWQPPCSPSRQGSRSVGTIGIGPPRW